MRIIGLFGHGNCGKSETLNELKELLRASGKSISLAEHPFCDKPETFEYKEITYIPGFLKIIYEIIDNSVDEAIRTNFKYAKNIGVMLET